MLILTNKGKYAPYFKMGSMFSDNARVYYKPHSLAAGGVGTVRNVSARGRRV